MECQRHEDLLNLAFADSPAFHLVCLYDTEALAPSVIEEAHCSHPSVTDGAVQRASGGYRGEQSVSARFGAPLPEPPPNADELAFTIQTFPALRRFVARHAHAARLPEGRGGDLVLAVNELASNSVRHGGGGGILRVWRAGDALVCEVRDSGYIEEPLAGRVRPGREQIGGCGLWIVNQLCDLVEMRTFADGSAVRLHMRAGTAARPQSWRENGADIPPRGGDSSTMPSPRSLSGT